MTDVIDLFSDTMTKPTPAMRRFMCEAEVGNEQEREDPTVNLLQEMVAELLGKEAALFLPSGTMCNQVAFAVWCRPGDEIIMDRFAHPLMYEAGGPAALSGAVIRTVDGERGIFTAGQVERAINPRVHYMPRSRAVSVETPTVLGGGACWPLERLREVSDAAHRHGLVAHLDGARLLNAVVATGVPAREQAAGFDSVWIDFTKGLGAPVGAALAGSRGFIEEAWVFKQRFGGAMRQAGIIAAAGVYALRHHVDRLAEDHEHARLLARGLAELPGIALDPETVETNIVLFDVAGTGLRAEAFAARALEVHRVRFSAMTDTLVRAVTHLDVSRDDIERALAAMRTMTAELARRGP
ncbi:MAG TPA: GntG family PLP-dependent aldolase [Gemmatimonadales bacterium]|nr:GntG family PLP-dependent aldolase [Gemmatimonadales bacterium]